MHRPGAPLAAAAVTIAAATSACGSDPARVSLKPVAIAGSACGHPADGRSLLLTALGDQREDVQPIVLGAAVAFDTLPEGTRQLAVSVLGSNGVVRAFGRTAPLDLDTLPDGAVIPIFMAPPDDGCPVSDLGEARDRPLVIAAGDGALIVGGVGAGGALLGTAEWYDPGTGTFTEIETPQAMRGESGAAGMAATMLPDGRVVLTGGARPVYAVFDPTTKTFDAPGALFEVRAHHAAVAIGGTRVLVAGGCGLLTDGACTPASARLGTFTVDVETGEILDGPTMTVERLDGAAYLEPDPTGAGLRRVVLTGGVDLAGDPVTTAERVGPDAGPAQLGTAIADAGGASARLASGALVSAFGPVGAPLGEIAVVVPGQPDVRVLATQLAREAPTLTSLEDGGLLVLGGAGDLAPVARLRSADGSIAVLPADPIDLAGDAFARAGHGAARLPDGTVLAAGGHDELGAPRKGAWVFRPTGDSAFSSAITVTPGADADAPLVPFDPAGVTTSPTYRLTAVGEALSSWAVIGGMQPRDVELSATLRIDGGAAILIGFVDAEHFDAIELRAAMPARLIRRDGAAEVERCRGDDAPALGGGDPVTVGVVLRDGQLDVTVGGAPALACGFEDARAGLTGVAALGDGAEVTLSTASVSR